MMVETAGRPGSPTSDRTDTMIDLNSHQMIDLLATYGYWAVFILVAIESMGVPVPGESTLLLASVYAGTTHRLSVILVIAVAASGAVAGDNLGYLAGRKGGYRLLRATARHLRLKEDRLKLGQYLFGRHGGKVVFFGRFMPVLRMWAGFLAGVHRMPWRRFLAFNAAGGIAWATLMGSLAYAFGSSVVRQGGPMGIATFALGAAVLAGTTLAARRGERRVQRQAEGCGRISRPLAA
jgi:membrane protein DedA with SNARE-associated domain